jgi:chaperonin GroES
MSMKKIKPLGNRLLVKRSESVVSKGGILLPETAKEKPKQGEVVAVGPGKMDNKGNTRPLDVQIGDLVLFGAYSGTEVKAGQGEGEYLILTEDDVLGVLV